jgi:hypothetical protein
LETNDGDDETSWAAAVNAEGDEGAQDGMEALLADSTAEMAWEKCRSSVPWLET